MDSVKKGFHYDAGPNAMLIQIVDPGHPFPTPLYKFKEIRQFEFLDIEKDDNTSMWESRMTEEQGQEIVKALVYAKTHYMNVIVHCHAGLCRSGAVCEVGVIMGFDDTETRRLPNTYVKGLLLKSMGVSYDSTEDEKKWFDHLSKEME